MSKLFSENIYCGQCKGACIGKDTFETQENAKKRFGIIPNNCVPDCNGSSRCPHKK